jgi:hypothetical protein
MLKSLPPTFWDAKVYERARKTLSTLAVVTFLKVLFLANYLNFKVILKFPDG